MRVLVSPMRAAARAREHSGDESVSERNVQRMLSETVLLREKFVKPLLRPVVARCEMPLPKRKLTGSLSSIPLRLNSRPERVRARRERWPGHDGGHFGCQGSPRLVFSRHAGPGRSDRICCCAAMTWAEFKKKWARYVGKESAAYQEHFNDLCRLLEQQTPAEAAIPVRWVLDATGPRHKLNRMDLDGNQISVSRQVAITDSYQLRK